MKTCSKLSFVLASVMLISSVLYAYMKESNIAARNYYNIMESGVLRVVVEQNNMSYSVNDDSTIVGLQYKMIEELAEDWKLSIHYIKVSDLGAAIDMLNNNEVDLLAWHIPIHVEMEENLAFTIPVFTSRQVLVQRKKSTTGIVRNQLDLAKQTIHIPKDSPYKQRIQNLAKEIGDTIYIEEINDIQLDSLFNKIAKGEINFTVCEQIVANVEKQQYPSLDTETAISFKQNYGWAVRQESTVLKDSLDGWLNVFLQSKEYNRMYRKYTKLK